MAVLTTTAIVPVQFISSRTTARIHHQSHSHSQNCSCSCSHSHNYNKIYSLPHLQLQSNLQSKLHSYLYHSCGNRHSQLQSQSPFSIITPIAKATITVIYNHSHRSVCLHQQPRPQLHLVTIPVTVVNIIESRCQIQ